MRRIEFIAPVEAMRGDLSGGEKNTYVGGQQAYEAAEQGTIYAENYSKRYIGAKKSANGKKYFSLKSRASVNMTQTRHAMAVFGGATSCALAARMSLALYTSLKTIYQNLGIYAKTGKSLQGWLMGEFYPVLDNKQASLTLTDGAASNPVSVSINNPWVDGGTGTELTISQEILDKFESELGAA